MSILVQLVSFGDPVLRELFHDERRLFWENVLNESCRGLIELVPV